LELINLKHYVGASCAIVGSVLSTLLGGWDVLLSALVAAAVLDYASGLIAAYIEKNLRSDVGYRGAAKKVLMFVLVALACTVDKAAGSEIVRTATISFYIGIEGLSVLENAGRSGIPLPGALRAALEELQKQGGGKRKCQK